MRKINRIVLHCSATKQGQEVTVAQITAWHIAQGWKTIGYHWVVLLDGSIGVGRPEKDIGAHVEGHNKDSIGVCYVGGLGLDGKPKDTRTEKQTVAMDNVIDGIRSRYGQHITVHGHNEFTNQKACPSFDVQKDRRDRRR